MDNWMTVDIIKTYDYLCDSLKDRYCRLLLLTGNSVKKTDMLSCLWPQECQVIHVGQALSALLLEKAKKQRAKSVSDFFSEMLAEDTMLRFTDIEILFSRELDINPLKLFTGLARNHMVIVNWPGVFDFSGNKLKYSEPEYSDYFCEDMTDDVLFLDESGRNSLNKTTGRSRL